jgi:Serine dehydrogenase proteinase
MSVGDIFWLFFIFSALQPMLRTAHTRGHAGAQHFLDRKRAKSRAIPLVHRQETMRFLGFPIARYVDTIPKT